MAIKHPLKLGTTVDVKFLGQITINDRWKEDGLWAYSGPGKPEHGQACFSQDEVLRVVNTQTEG